MIENEAVQPDRGKFRKNTFMQYMLQLAKYIFPFITIPYLTRVLGPDTYAIRAYMLAVMGFIMVVLDYGFTTYGTKVIADAHGDTSIENPFTTAIMEMRVILCVVVIPIVIGLTFAIPIMAQNPVYVALAYASVVLKALLPDFVFQGREDMAIIKNLDFDRGIINKCELGAHGDAAFSKLEWSTTGCFLDFLGCFLIFDFMAFRLNFLKSVGCS